jgi:shikimate kinase
MDPSASNTKILLPRIDAGDYIMLYGARASGKTTRAYKLQEQLQDKYSVLDSSFQAGVEFATTWCFGSRLEKNFRE